MVFLPRLLPLSLLTFLTFANPLAAHKPFLLHHSRHVLPLGFSLAGPAAPDTLLTLRIALPSRHPNALVDALNSVSDPSSGQYRQFLSKLEVEQLVAPSAEALSAVNTWLQEHGISATPISPAGDWLEIRLLVSQANALLNADFSTFTLPDSGRQVVRTMSYSIPPNLASYIDLIHPTTVFPDPQAIQAEDSLLPKRAIHEPVFPRASSSRCANGTTPECIQQLYNIPKTPAKESSNRLAVTGRYGNIAHYDWLKEFLIQHRPDMDPSTNITVSLVDGGNNDQDGPSVSEGELDIQYTVSLATKVPVEYVMVGVKSQDGGLNGWFDEAHYLLSLENPHQVLTTSYGYPETSMSFALTDKLCKSYAQLGVRGVSVLFASGDSGVGCKDSKKAQFEPMFPSNCPYVTSVGGTQGHAPEEAWSGSGGGFSNYYPAPPYQAPAVASYLSKLDASALSKATRGEFNRTGRAFPDVAAKADAFRVWEGKEAVLSGTSASSPTFASVVALLNDRLAQAGKPPLGFLNPWLYKTGWKGLNDIVQGESQYMCKGKDVGFGAVEGWDPVTGLGTPDFAKLLKLLES